MRAAVIQFPGSNCDVDLYKALRQFGVVTNLVSDQTTSLADYDAVFFPGGFSFGDYLRSGAIARFSPVTAAVKGVAARGGLVVGICNGFQILTEAGLLPGQLMMNAQPGFICDEVAVELNQMATPFTRAYQERVVTYPIAHAEGRYYADPTTLAHLEQEDRIVFRYQRDVNGSSQRIAGITNTAGNVLGMMPHPERAVDALLGNTAGRAFFESMLMTVDGKEGPKG